MFLFPHQCLVGRRDVLTRKRGKERLYEGER